MRLKSIGIRRVHSWEAAPKTSNFVGTLEVESPNGEIKINLSDEACRQILVIAGEGIKGAALETASFLSSEASVLALTDEASA